MSRGSEGIALGDENPPLRRRVARLSRLTVALIGLTLVLSAVALWVAFREAPTDIVGQLPLGADDDIPSLSLILAAGAGMASVFVGLAALHVAAAMRVLARDRRIPPPLPAEMRKLRGAVLPPPLGPDSARLVAEPEPPPSKLADLAEIPRGRLSG